MNKFEKFNKYEKILFRIHMSVFAFGLFLLSLVFLAQNAIESIARTFLGVTYTLLYVVLISFAVSVVRLIKYLIVFRKSQDMVSIRRSVAVMFTSPIALGVYFIITLAMSLSLVSCS
jgi:hypothetical protein